LLLLPAALSYHCPILVVVAVVWRRYLLWRWRVVAMVAGEAAMVCYCCGDGSGDGLALKDGGDDDNDMRQWQLWRWPGLEAWG
jgi:hypothetical protein